MPPLMAFNNQQQRYFYNQAPCQHQYYCCGGGQGSPGRIRRNSFGGMCLDSSPTGHYFVHGTSPSSLEGHFIPPELPEETLLEVSLIVKLLIVVILLILQLFELYFS